MDVEAMVVVRGGGLRPMKRVYATVSICLTLLILLSWAVCK